MKKESHNRVLRLAQFSLLLALEAIVCFTPLGSIPIAPPGIVATLSHLPVIITAILLGIGPGALMGFFFGLFSFLVWTLFPPVPPIAFLFTPFSPAITPGGEILIGGNGFSLLICFVPRILIGVVAGLSFRISQKRRARTGKGQALSYTLSGLLGSLTNTILVLSASYVFFCVPNAALAENSYALLLLIFGASVFINGVLEAAAAILVTNGVCHPLKRFVMK